MGSRAAAGPPPRRWGTGADAPGKRAFGGWRDTAWTHTTSCHSSTFALYEKFQTEKKISKTKFCRFASSFWRAGSPQLGGICAGLMQPHGSSRPAEARATCTPAPGPPAALPAHCCVSSRGLPEPCPLVSAPARPYPPLSIPMPAWCWGTESLKCTC